jgi:Flp pilus assembly protein TadB
MSVPDQHLPQQDEQRRPETPESEFEAAPQSHSLTRGYRTHQVTAAAKRWSRKRWLVLALIAAVVFVGLASVVILVVTFSPLKDAMVNATESPLVSVSRPGSSGERTN